MWLLIALVLFTLVVIVILRLTRESRSQPTTPTYTLRPLMSAREQQLYWRLVKAFEDHVVFAQVGPGAFLQGDYNRIAQLRCDFVVCDKSTHPKLVIELNGWSHENETQRARDVKKRAAVESAGVRFVAIGAKELPNVETLRKLL